MLPIYYGGLVINSFVGASGTAQIVELNINDTYISGYAAFEGGALARVVLISLQPYTSSSAGDRPQTHLRDIGNNNGALWNEVAIIRIIGGRAS